MSMSEEAYLAFRKRKARWLNLRFRLCHIFSIQKHRVVFSTYEGDGGFCCNPRYIAEELHRRHPEAELIWLSHSKAGGFPPYIHVVRDTPWRVAYYLSTAHIWIDNYRKPMGTLKRAGQIYIQTWHASLGFKAVGLYRGKAFPEIARRVSAWDSQLIDRVLSNSDYCDRIYPKKLLYDGPTLRVGSPRVDPLISCREELKERLHDQLQLAPEIKCLLYAPTFRGGVNKDKKQVIAEMPSLDFSRMLRALEQKTGNRWCVLLRLHPQLAAKLDKMPIVQENDAVFDVSRVPDMSDILGGCDALTTDYSSCAFDAAFAGIPVLLYADDIAAYEQSRGSFMWSREELPFPLAEDNASLVEAIRSFDEDAYLRNVRGFVKQHGIVEDGHAAQKVVDFLESYL